MPPMLTAVNELVGKADGKDKLLATIQYVLMFLAAGNPGTVKDIQVKVASARKVFRIMKPIEMLTPVLRQPLCKGDKATVLELLPKLKNVLMATYFAFDHLVWFGSVSLIQDKKLLERFQKISLWSWLLGSTTTIASELTVLLDGSSEITREVDEAEDAWQVRRAAFRQALRKRIIVLVHAITQALLATGLLQLRPFKPRTTATFGVIASAMNCYMLAPTLQAWLHSWVVASEKPALKTA